MKTAAMLLSWALELESELETVKAERDAALREAKAARSAAARAIKNPPSVAADEGTENQALS